MLADAGLVTVVLTVDKKSGQLLSSPDIISRGFIYLRDSEELMGIIRQYLKQKVARTFSGRRVDLDVVKKEIKDELTHVLYDQTRRTPIVIPVINEIGGGGGGKGPQQDGEGAQNGRPDNRNNNRGGNRGQGQNQGQSQGGEQHYQRPAPKVFQQPAIPDTDVIAPKAPTDSRGY